MPGFGRSRFGGHLRDYMKSKNNEFNRASVSKEELFDLLVKSGLTKEKATFDVKMCESLHSGILINRTIYSIIKDE